MPKNNGIGYSDYTPKKQKIYRSIVIQELAIINRILNFKHKSKDWHTGDVLIIDTTAGPGIYENIVGSPLIVAEELNQYPKLKTKSIFIEENQDHYLTLRTLLNNLNRSPNHEFQSIRANNEVALRKLLEEQNKWNFGWIYNDPSGDIPIFDTLSKITDLHQFKPLDIIISCPATTIKRVRCSGLCKEERSLIDYLREFKKNFWWISESYGKHQWVFLFGSNWKGFEFGHIPLYSVESNKGKKIFKKICLTKTEIENGN